MIPGSDDMETLPGFPMEELENNYDSSIEARYPWLGAMFGRFLMQNTPTEFPISASIVVPDAQTDTLAGSYFATNSTNGDLDSTRHAELKVIQRALNDYRDKHLPDEAVLVSSVEPCAMCASALIHSKVSTVIFGAKQEDLRGRNIKVSGTDKPFRAEPADYSSQEFINKRDPSITVIGGYRRREIIDLMLSQSIKAKNHLIEKRRPARTPLL